jgi:threonine/homoserine/homoserine lactone efflux protein
VDGSFLTFLGVSILVIVAPGPDTALTIRNTLLAGRAGGIGTALGVSIGQLIWAAATSVGLVAVLLASEPVFRAVKLAGAAYLIWLGVQSLRTALRPNRPGPSVERATGRLPTRAAFVQGIVNNLGNPKMAVFFASVLPQFTAPGQGMGAALVLLGVVFFRSGPGRTRRQGGRRRSMSAG